MNEPRVPSKVLESLMAQVENDLRIRVPTLGAKLVSLHLVASVLTLSLCQQFGMKIPVLSGFDLMHVFMLSGAFGCQLFCGAFYLGSSFALMTGLLPRHELHWLKNNIVPVGLGFVVLSALLLSVMGDALAPLYLAAWATGAFAAALLSFFVLRGLRLSQLRLS